MTHLKKIGNIGSHERLGDIGRQSGLGDARSVANLGNELLMYNNISMKNIPSYLREIKESNE